MAASSGTVTVKLSGDAKGLLGVFQEVAAASSGVSDEVKAKFAEAAAAVDAMMADLKAKADEARDQAIAAKAEADAALAAGSNNNGPSLLDRLSKLGNVVTGLNQGSQLMDRFRHSTDEASASVDHLGEDGTNESHKLRDAIIALAPAVSGIGSTVAALGVGLVGTFGAAAGGLAIFKLASGAVTDQFKTDATAVLTSWQTAMAPFVQGVYTRAVGLLKQGLTDITPVVKPVSDALQGVEKDFQQVLGSAAVTNGFKLFGAQAAAAINAIGPALANIVPFALNLFQAMNPLTILIEGFIKTIGPQLPSFASALSKPFQQLATLFTQIGPLVGSILANIASAVLSLLKAIEPLVPFVLQLLTAFTGLIADDLAKFIVPIGQAFGQLLSAVEPLITPLLQVANILVGALAGGLKTIIVALVPVVSMLAQGLGPILIPLANLLGGLATVIGQSLAGSIKAFLPIFSALLPVATSFAGALASALLPVLNSLVPAIQNMTKYTFVFPALLGGLVSLLPAIQQILPAVAQLIGPAAQLFTDILSKGGIVLENLLPPLIQFASQIISGIGPAVSDLAPVVGTLAASFGTLLGKVATDLLPALQPLVPIIVNLANNVGGALLKAFTDFAPLIGDLAPIIAELVANGLTEMVGVFQILAPILGAVLGPALQIVKALFDALVPVFPAIFAAIRDLIPAVVEIAQSLGGSLGQVLVQLLPIILQLVQTAVVPLLNALLPLLPTIAQLVAALLPLVVLQTELYLLIVSKLLPVLAPLIELLAKVAATVIGAVVGALNTLIQWITKVVSAISGWVGNAQRDISTITGFFKALPGDVADAFHAVVGAIEGAFSGVADWVNDNVVKPTVGFFVGLPGKIVTAIGSVLSAGKHIVDDILQGVHNEEVNIWNWVKGVPAKVLSTIGSLLSSGVHIVDDILQGVHNEEVNIWNWVAGLPAKFVSGITNIASALKGVGSSLLSAIIGGIVGDAGAIGTALKNAVKAGVSSIPVIGGALSKIPGLATGGLVTAPTLAVVGEAGYPEMVLPLKHGLTALGFAQAVNDAAGGSAPRIGNLLPGTAGNGASGITFNQFNYSQADANQIAQKTTFQLSRLVS